MGAVPAHRHAQLLTRLLLVFGTLYGLGIYVATPLASPAQLMLASDVYAHAAGRLLDGEVIYHSHPTGRPGYHYLYPPIVTILFLPHALLGSSVGAFLLQTGVNLAAAVGTAVLIMRLLGRRGVELTRLDRTLIVAFFLLSSYSAIQFINGQVNLWLAFAFALAFDAMDRDRGEVAGIAFGLAALVKVFPAVMGLWLLRLRARVAVGAALATGVAGLILGGLVLGPDLTVTYITEVLLGRFEGSTFDGRPAVDDGVDGIHRQLAAVWPAGTRWHSIIGLGIIGGLLAMSYARTETVRARDLAGLATIASILLFLPLQPLYFPLVAVPLLLVLYTLPPGLTGWLLAIGAALTMFHLDQQSLSFALTLTPLPDGIADWILSGTAELFRVILPPTLGLWLVLGACAMRQSTPLARIGDND